MLSQIVIENIAVIEKASVAFSSGLNVLTGETGAGKSVIIDALGIAMGGRGDRELIRTGAKSASVSALFFTDRKMDELLKEADIAPQEDGGLIVYREITDQGRGVCKINGSMCTVGQLREIGRHLVNIHGQNDSLLLTDTQSHIHMLDQWAGTASLLTSFKQNYQQYKALLRKAKDFSQDEAARLREIDVLEYQIGEIQSVAPKMGEDMALGEQVRIMGFAQSISEGMEELCSLISSGSTTQSSIANARAVLLKLANKHPATQKMEQEICDVLYKLEDLAQEANEINASMQFDPEHLAQMQDRAEAITRLKAKYGGSIEAVLSYEQSATQRDLQLKNHEQQAGDIEKEIGKLEILLKRAAEEITIFRKERAVSLQKEVISALEGLNMEGVIFEVSFIALGEYNQTGRDGVEFLISPNPGEEPKPLAKIASGGELSRIMLAFKCVMAAYDDTDVYVFDEIDAGISGKTAALVAQRLRSVSALTQTICITHLSQIAASADHHYLIEKNVEGGRTHTTLRLLDIDGRIAEIARINSGMDASQAARSHAKEMIERYT